ncbi:MAG: hypothetical protein ACMXYG_07470 [Candidatus Woesearchaeota archaeon]
MQRNEKNIEDMIQECADELSNAAMSEEQIEKELLRVQNKIEEMKFEKKIIQKKQRRKKWVPVAYIAQLSAYTVFHRVATESYPFLKLLWGIPGENYRGEPIEYTMINPFFLPITAAITAATMTYTEKVIMMRKSKSYQGAGLSAITSVVGAGIGYLFGQEAGYLVGTSMAIYLSVSLCDYLQDQPKKFFQIQK